MNGRLLRCAIIVSFAGFLFGFHSVLISGASLHIKETWQLSDWYHGAFVIAASLWGTAIGALIGGYPSDRLGRKTTLLMVAALFIISAVGSAAAGTPGIFSFFRFLGGLGAGIGSIAAPAYISEISRAQHRGKLGMMFQLNLVIGILAAFFANYAFDGVGGTETDWRWMMGSMLLPALIFFVLLFTIIESPRWSILKGKKTAEATAILTALDDHEALRSVADSRLTTPADNESSRLFSGRYNRILKISFLMAFFNQFSGISVVLLYAPAIFEKAGFGSSDSMMGGVFIGAVNLICTIASILMIDRFGRKTLMYLGSAGYIISLSMIACAFYFELPAQFTLTFVLLFIVSHALGQGAVIWVFLSEIFPTRIRPFGQAWASGFLNGFAALTAMFGAVLINQFPTWIIFSVFGVLMVLQLLFTAFMMPETKGVSLEALEAKLVSGSSAPFGRDG